ncbi:hypothetical protein SAMN05216382_0569 [Sphingomonas palmae]|uniref:Uncharacterized protein n=1 Tax=Sphingomonas palmae TaxID=1855283 RepID=A0A1H7HRM9_9SPHN|nr:hypothetical protein [Sphingomonas palmae]SEK52182.1 hypothetical protein SAMN05216382_0569 [Sphingomonas palmae]
MRQSLVAAGLLGLAACSSPDQSGQLTPDQDARLNSAAEMLDANSVAFDDASDNVTDTVENQQ